MIINSIPNIADLATNIRRIAHLPQPKTALRSVLWTGLFMASAFTMGTPAHADIGATHTSLISEFASFNTPGVVDGRVQTIAIDGDTVFVGGTFTQIQEPLDGEIINQPYLFAYSKSTGNIIRDFDPVLNSTVFALETTGDGTGIFVGGQFNIVNGQSNLRGLVKLDDNGDRTTGFIPPRPNAVVNSLVRLGNKLYIGGKFNTIGQQPIESLAAIDTTSGSVLPEVDLDFDGVFSTFRTTGVLGIDDIDITSDGRLLVAIGNFERVDGLNRERMVVVELDGQARVSNWNSNVYDVQCPAQIFPQYIRGIDIAADDSYFVTGSSGFRTPGVPACDSIIRFDFGNLSDGDVQPTWVNYTGGDSVYDVVATDHAIYAGGHFRWLDNDTSIDGRSAGPGSVPRAGLAALDPLNGLTLLDWQSDRNPRGLGTFALIAEDEGLYIGDDTDFLNGSKHAKLKFLPISSDTISRPDAPTLPTTILHADGVDLFGSSFNGSNIGASTELRETGFSSIRGAMYIGGKLFHANSLDRIFSSQYNGNTFETRVDVELFGLTDNEWDIDQIGGMFYDYDRGRVYYAKRNDSRLFWRAFTPDNPHFGNDKFIAETQGDIPWSDVSGMDVINGYLYFGRTNGNLYRSEIDGVDVVSGTTQLISGPGVDGRNWNKRSLAFMGEGALLGDTRGAQVEFQASGSQSSGRFQNFQFEAAAGEPVVVSVEWQDPSASVNVFVRDENGDTVAFDSSGAGSPKVVTAPAGNGGTYTVAVLVQQGATSYTVKVNPDEVPTVEPAADFEFSTSGTPTSGNWQVFNFDVTAGELVEANVIWNDPNAVVNVFLRNENRALIMRDIDRSGSGFVSAIAESSGRWSVAVKINSGNVNYDVLVDTTPGFSPPAPLADFEFSATGNPTTANWHVFNFDVEAGDLVTADVTWDNPNAEVNVFLRNENRTLVMRDIDRNGSGFVTAIAENGGRWSVAVKINSGTVNFDVLVNTD